MLRGKMHFAFFAGISAALGSVFGKLSGAVEILEHFVDLVAIPGDEAKTSVVYVLQLVMFGLMLFCNASVWSFYVKALNSSSSSLPATVISTATNYVVSALFGMLLFKEATSLIWWAGTGLVIAGLAIIAKNESAKPKIN